VTLQPIRRYGFDAFEHGHLFGGLRQTPCSTAYGA